MEVFLIFDNDFDTAAVARFLKDKQAVIHLFPLTSNFLVITKIQRALQALPRVEINLMESAQYINDEVINMQKTILSWSSGIANDTIGGKSIKDWFIMPDGSGSSWWYGILSEKNAVQEPVFFKIAQINAVKARLANRRYDLCVIGAADKQIKKIVAQTARNLRYKVAYVIPAKAGSHILQSGLPGALLAAAINVIVWLRDSREARRALPALKSRLRKDNPFLFISYFPNIDNEAAKKGIFRNKYALALQDKLNEFDVPVTWLLMPVYYNGHNFKSAMRLAKTFAAQGEKITVLQEFFNYKIFFKSLAWWLRQAALGLYLYAKMDKHCLTGKLTHPESLPIIKYLWLHSFVGTSSVRGIIFYLTYREVFKSIPHVKTCLYYCEMQAWEKAFLTAKKQISPRTRALAFQHTVVGRNYYNYFYDTNDTRQHASASDFPAPDLLIANGNRMYAFLAESNYPNLCQAEAVRQLYLSKNNRQAQKSANERPILFVGGSCDKTEMKSLITLLYTAYPIVPSAFDVWIKASPVNPVEPLFEELGIDAAKAGYQIFHTDVSELISSAAIALIANTTVAIEAAAKGCPVMVPVFADTLLMNPVVGTTASYYLVSTVSEFKSTVAKLLQSGRQDSRNGHAFIEEYWNIDPGIPLWTNILNQTVLCNEAT